MLVKGRLGLARPGGGGEALLRGRTRNSSAKNVSHNASLIRIKARLVLRVDWSLSNRLSRFGGRRGFGGTLQILQLSCYQPSWKGKRPL